MANVTVANNIDVQRYFAHFLGTYEGDVAGLWYKDVMAVYDTPSITTDFPGLEPMAGLSALQTTGRVDKTPTDFKVAITKATFEDNVAIQRTYYESDTLGLLGDKVADMADAAQYAWNANVLGLLNNGDSTTGYDGVNFFSNAHINAAASNNISNKIKTPSGSASAATAAAWAVVGNPTAVTALEAATITANAIGYMQSLLGYNGLPVNAGMRSIKILSGDYMNVASFVSTLSMQVVPQTSGSGIESNPVLGFQRKGFTIDAEYVPTLTSGKIFVIRTDSRSKPFIGVETADAFHPSFEGDGSYYANQFDKYRFGIKVDRGTGYGSFLSALEINLATS